MERFERDVKIALIEREMSQQKLADRLGISLSYLGDLIKGKRKNDKQIERIKQELEIDR